MQPSTPVRFPLLEAMLEIKGLTIKAMYTNADVAKLFDTSVRTVQKRSASGSLSSRKLIGRARFLPIDLENFLAGCGVPVA